MIRVVSMLVTIAALSVPAAAQTAWPDRPVRLIVPFPAGSATDVVSRLVAQKLTAKLGQQFVVENRAGASGAIGVDIVAKAAPDGTTMGLITASTHALAPALGAKLPYDTVKDFKPVSMIFDAPYALVLYPGIPVKSVAELVALAKTSPGKFNYGSAGLASLAHLAGALFATQTGIELTHVPYRSSAQSSIDMITGRLDMQFATVAPTLANIREGKLKALATTGLKRISVLPDVPTMIEQGLQVEIGAWFGFLAPAGTPQAAITWLSREGNKVLSPQDVKGRFVNQGAAVPLGTPESFAKFIEAESNRYGEVIRRAGIKIEGQ
jgi:tripartite-type tricarboxylate transporter receptor subunit TctC